MQLTSRQEKLCRGNCQIESCPNNKKCFQVTATVSQLSKLSYIYSKRKKTSPFSIFENKILQPAKSAKISFSKMYSYVNVNITDVSAPYFQKKLLCIFTLNKRLCRNQTKSSSQAIPTGDPVTGAPDPTCRTQFSDQDTTGVLWSCLRIHVRESFVKPANCTVDSD